MADETQAVTVPAQAAGGNAADGTGGAQGVQTGSDAEDTMSLDEARKLRREAQALRKRLAEFEDREKEAQAAALSDAEKLQKRLTEVEQANAAAQKRHQEAVVRYEVMLKAANMQIVDPDAAVRLLDWQALTFDEDGAPSNVEKLLKELVKAKPYLVKQVQAPAPNINAAATGTRPEAEAARLDDLKRRFRLG